MSEEKNQLVLVSGMSGAGRSSAMRALEDIGFEAVDNLPLKLLGKLVSGTVSPAEKSDPYRLAVGIDIRGRDFNPTYFFQKLSDLQEIASLNISILFVDCDDSTLIRRYKETRRPHPLAPDRPIADGLKLERRLIGELYDKADIVINTAPLQLWQFKDRLRDLYGQMQDGMHITLISFGFKKGLPREADLVFDVRFLSNPYYDPALRPMSGLDKDVGDVISNDADFEAFMISLKALFALIIPRYEKEGKSNLSIAIGCTGGRHRSVFVTEKLASWFINGQNRPVHRYHRDLVKPPEEATSKRQAGKI